MKHPTWDNVDWENTHIECASGQYHLGVIDIDYQRFLAIGAGKDDSNPGIILLSDDDVDDFLSALRKTAKSL